MAFYELKLVFQAAAVAGACDRCFQGYGLGFRLRSHGARDASGVCKISKEAEFARIQFKRLGESPSALTIPQSSARRRRKENNQKHHFVPDYFQSRPTICFKLAIDSPQVAARGSIRVESSAVPDSSQVRLPLSG
jgi:hypothetical protein